MISSRVQERKEKKKTEQSNTDLYRGREWDAGYQQGEGMSDG